MTSFRALPLAMLLCASPCLADEDGAGEQIVVTGQGLPETPAAPAYAVREITRETIITVPSGRIEEALATVAGFQQFRRSDSRSSNPSAQGVTLRALGGNASSRALVLLDGVPMGDPFFGFVPFAALVPEQIGTVQVVRGGGSGPFGSGALAGTLALVSEGIDALGPLNGSLLVNDRGETEASAGLALRLGAGQVTASGRWDRGAGFWTTPADQRVAASVPAAFDSYGGQTRVVVPLSSAWELQARLLAFDDRRSLRFAGADSRATGQDASVRLVGRGPWQIDALAYVQARDFSNVVISATSFRPVLDQTGTPATGIGGKFELRPPVGGRHLLRIGADYRRSSGEMREEAISGVTGLVTARRNGGGATSDIGLYLEDDWTVGRLVLTGGVRVDRTAITGGFLREATAAGSITLDNRFDDRRGWTASWRGGALLRADDRLSLRAVGYSGLRLPTLNELYRPFVVFPVTTRANAELLPERLEGFETGIDWTPASAVSLSLTAFDNRVRNAIANVSLGPNLRQRQNLPALRARGIEFAAQIRRGQVSFDSSLAFTDAVVRGEGLSLPLDGRAPAQSPRWAASARLAWQPRAGRLVALSLRHVGAQFEDDLGIDRLPAATTLGGYAQIMLTGRLALVLRAENLTGERVETRRVGNSIDLGAPRSVWGGLRFGY